MFPQFCVMMQCFHVSAFFVYKPKRGASFPNVDGIRFLTHQLGCGGTRQDARALCGLLAGYIHHANVAGATVLSLGCQNAQASILMEELRARDPEMGKPVLVFDQQKSGLEGALLDQALDKTFAALAQANLAERAPAPLSALTVALQCGGSDGFSGVSANPSVGYMSDLVVGAGGTTILSEFPELHGVEQELINRCATDELAARFAELMQAYAARARAVQSDFAFNPSPGNIRDGLITDAIKSAGAARKGGVSPVSAVIDYPEYADRAGTHATVHARQRRGERDGAGRARARRWCCSPPGWARPPAIPSPRSSKFPPTRRSPSA